MAITFGQLAAEYRQHVGAAPSTGKSCDRVDALDPEDVLKHPPRSFAALLGLALVIAAGPGISRADDAADADAATSTPTLEELNGKLEGLTEQLQTLQADTDKLKKFKLSGYVQARWETAENKNDSVRVAGTTITPANSERFYIRRGRLKLTYDASPWSQAVLYIDGGTDRTVRLLEAYVTLMDQWTPDHRHQLTVGQMNVPFGYEIERSSSARELPERSRAENVLFSGERDRGLKIVNAWTPKLETTVSILNGGGVNHADFPNTDPTRKKDFTGRVRFMQGTFDAAVSWYQGKNLIPLTGPDVETNKTRLGLDAQLYYALPTLGGGSLRGEFYRGEEVNPDSVRRYVSNVTAGRLLAAGAPLANLDTDFTGGYVMWVQNLGEQFQFAARWDKYDANTDIDHDQFERVGLGLNWFYGGLSRVTVSYDIPKTDVSVGGGRFDDPNDNLWTVQVQHKY